MRTQYITVRCALIVGTSFNASSSDPHQSVMASGTGFNSQRRQARIMLLNGSSDSCSILLLEFCL